MKKRLEETQTLRAGCSKVEPKIFAPPQTPFPGTRDGQSLISWRWSLPLPTNPVWWGSMHAISSYRGNRPTQKHTQTGAITIHCAAASAQCNEAQWQCAIPRQKGSDMLHMKGFFWCTGAVLVRRCSWCHQWFIWLTAGTLNPDLLNKCQHINYCTMTAATFTNNHYYWPAYTTDSITYLLQMNRKQEIWRLWIHTR